jgi:hypothetical protein
MQSKLKNGDTITITAVRIPGGDEVYIGAQDAYRLASALAYYRTGTCDIGLFKDVKIYETDTDISDVVNRD